MNTNKNVITSAGVATIMLGAIYIFFLISTLYKGYFNVPFRLSLILWITLAIGVIGVMVLLMRTKKNRKIKFFDFRENAYPVDMEHNDEREWRLMLTATYVSARLTIIYLILVFLVPYTASLFGLVFGTQFWMIFSATTLFVGIMINEWGYVFTYLHLNKS